MYTLQTRSNRISSILKVKQAQARQCFPADNVYDNVADMYF